MCDDIKGKQPQDRGDITKDELKNIVFITALNASVLTDGTQRQIDTFDIDTYLRLLNMALERREKHDLTGASGGGTWCASYLQEAIKNLDHILSQ